MQIVTQLNDCDYNYSNKIIVVSLDDKYVGVVFEETGDKVVVISDDEIHSHHRFEIPKCKIMMMSSSSSISKRMILDLEYADILKYKTEY
jgi:hypothetical protein